MNASLWLSGDHSSRVAKYALVTLAGGAKRAFLNASIESSDPPSINRAYIHLVKRWNGRVSGCGQPLPAAWPVRRRQSSAAQAMARPETQ